jgi:AAA domain
MSNQPTDNSNELIWPKGQFAGAASKLLDFTELVVAAAQSDPDVNTEELASFIEENAAAAANLPTISKLTDLPTITELTAEPVKWVVDRILPYGCLTMLVGSQGSMKTMLAMYAAQTIAGHTPGRTFLGRKVMHGIPVLYVDRENPEAEISDRARYMGIMGNRNFIYWGDFNKGEQTPQVDDPRLLDWASKHNLLIVFDSLQDWYGDENENDNSAMVKLLGKFRKLARAGAGVLLLHHKNAAGERARGGTSITNLTDMAIKAGKNEDDPNVIELREERFRMCGGWELDVKAHWNAGEFHDNQKHYQLELLRDQLKTDAVKDKKEEQRRKAEGKQANDREDTAKVVALIDDTGKSPATIETRTGLNRNRVIKLAGAVGRVWDTETKTWNGRKDFGMEDPHG